MPHYASTLNIGIKIKQRGIFDLFVGASDYVSEKATGAMEAVSGAMAQGKEKIDDAYDGDSKIIKMPTDMDNVKDTMREKIGDTYDNAKENIERASDKASSMGQSAYEEGKQKMNLASEKFSDGKASEVYDDESRDKVKALD